MNLAEGFKVLFGLIGRGFILLGWPFKKIGQGIFNGILVTLYQKYRKGKKGVRISIAPLQKSFLYPFMHRHLAFITLIVLGVVIGVYNITLRNVEAHQLGMDSIIASLNANPDADTEEVVMGVPPKETSLFASIITPVEATPLPTTYIESSSRTDNVVYLAGIGGGENNTSSRNVAEYVVQGGDSISIIASRFNVSTQSVLWANGMNEFDFIKPGQKLKIPPVSGVVHTIASGDTVNSIAKKYSVSESSILEYNRLADASLIKVGQTLIVPGGTPPAPPKPAVTSTPSSSYASIPPSASVATSTRFSWPTSGHRITQYFRYGHTGVDIDGDYSSPIYAAASGVVESVQYLRYGYGYHIIIRHADGTKTLYAHASKIFVTAGQGVGQGQTIAMVGTTGRSSGTHLHFEIIIGGRKVNPLSYIR